MTEHVSVWVTAGSRAQAEALGRLVVEERLAACANVVDGLLSIYRWEGRVQTEAEAGLLLKTRAALLPALRARLVQAHAYELPCIVAWPIVDGHRPYLDWIDAQTRAD